MNEEEKKQYIIDLEIRDINHERRFRDLEHQLQAYKTKEDKLRKIIENNLFIAYEEEQSTINICFWEELQQILNEGGKE